MASFQVDSTFTDYASVVAAKKRYEESSNTVLVKTDCIKLKDADSDFGKRFVYQRIVFECKAGGERKPQSKGLRNSSTIKKNCPVKVRLSTRPNFVLFLRIAIFTMIN